MKTPCINITLTYRHSTQNPKQVFNIVTQLLFQLASSKNHTLVKEHTMTSILHIIIPFYNPKRLKWGNIKEDEKRKGLIVK